jgi:transcriptional regulator with XRE-family HTH domain
MKALAIWLEQTNTTQTELARLCEVSQPTISDLIRGQHMPSAKLLKRLMQVTGLSADRLLASEAA